MPKTSVDTNNDIVFINYLLKIGYFMAIVPSSNGNSKCRKVYSVCLILLYCLFTILSLKTVFPLIDKRLDAILTPVEFLTELSTILVSILSANFLYEKTWCKFLRSMYEIDCYFYGEVKVKKTIKQFFTETILLIVIYIVISLYDHIFSYYVTHDLDLEAISFQITTIYQLYTLVLTIYIVNFIEQRYNFLNSILLSTKFNEIDGISKIKHFTKIYRKLNEIVDDFNTIFGWFILLYIFNIIIIVAYWMAYVLTENRNVYETIPNCSYPCLHCIMGIILLFSCHRVEQTGHQFINECYFVQESVPNQWDVRIEILIAAKCAKNLKPIFSAAGMFDLNRGTICMVFSALMTYLIIVIQFNQ